MTVFVDPVSGNNTNDGLASGAGAVQTGAQAMAIVADQFNLTNGVAVTIQFADGTYTRRRSLRSHIENGNGQIIVQGNVTTPNNVLFQTTIVRIRHISVFECGRRFGPFKDLASTALWVW